MSIEKPKKEVQRNSDVVKEMIGSQKAGKGKDGMRQMSYYLTDELIKALAFKAARTGLDRSALVREALTQFLQDEIDRLYD